MPGRRFPRTDCGLSCASCQGKTRVLETRQIDGMLRRRRVCVRCGARLTTMEMVLAGANLRGPMIAVSRRSLQRIALITQAALTQAGRQGDAGQEAGDQDADQDADQDGDRDADRAPKRVE